MEGSPGYYGDPVNNIRGLEKKRERAATPQLEI